MGIMQQRARWPPLAQMSRKLLTLKGTDEAVLGVLAYILLSKTIVALVEKAHEMRSSGQRYRGHQ